MNKDLKLLINIQAKLEMIEDQLYSVKVEMNINKVPIPGNLQKIHKELENYNHNLRKFIKLYEEQEIIKMEEKNQ